MAGWDAYMDTLDGYAQNKMTCGGIYGKDGSKWTSRGDFNPSPAEMTTLTKVCQKGSSDQTHAQTNGIMLGGQKYKYVKYDSDDESLDFTTSDGGKQRNGNVMMTKQGAVVCICEEDSKSSTAKTASGKMGKYLKDTGY